MQAPGSKANPCHDTPENHAPALLRPLPKRGHPRRCATLCGMVSNHSVALYHPLPYGQRTAPSKKDGRALEGGGGRLLHARTGLCRDVRLVGAVTSVAIGPVRPSPPPRRHPGHCIPVPDAVEAYGDRTPPLQPLCLVRPTSTAPSSLHVDGPRTDNLYAATLEAAHGRAQDAP
jgi:hypothetical protein